MDKSNLDLHMNPNLRKLNPRAKSFRGGRKKKRG